jgi:aerobic carbon-monoxide dehydrogenase medium subunit
VPVDVLVPTSAGEATSLFGDGDGITVVAGGTIVLPEVAAGRLAPTRALMLHSSGLDRITVEDGRVVIGAMVSVATLADAAEDVLARFARQIADGEVRRNATVGGNVCAPPGRDAQRGDLGPPLIALGARVRSTGRGGERVEPVEEFLAGDRSGRLVLALEYDEVPRRAGASELRRRHAHSYAVASVAACAREDGSDLRVGIGGVAPVAARARTVEQSRDPAEVLADVEPVDDAVATAAYRRRVLPRLVGEALAGLGTG